MKTVLKTSKNVLVEGPMDLTLLRGKINIFNAKLEKERQLRVFPGRCLPIETSTYVELKLEGKGTYREISNRLFPARWVEAMEKLEKVMIKKDTPKALIIGDLNTGKSSLALFLLNTMINKESPLGIIDADVGQSKIGPPGTIGSAIVSKQITSLYNIEIHDAYFIGDKSPSGHLLQMVTGVKKLSERLESRSDLSGIIVDSTGMIFGGAARALKRHKIEIFSPNIIFALEKNREVDHIMRENPRENFFRVPVPKRMKPVSRSSRINLRKTSFQLHTSSIFSEMSLSLRRARIQQSILRNGYKVPKELFPFLEMIEWAEISTEGLLIVTCKALEDHLYENIINRFKKIVRALKGIETIEKSNILKVDPQKRKLLELVKGIKPKDLRISVISSSFYQGLMVGLKRNKVLYGIGRIQDIDFDHEKIHLEGFLLQKGKKKKILLPSTLTLGFLRLNSNWEEIDHRRVGRG